MNGPSGIHRLNTKASTQTRLRKLRRMFTGLLKSIPKVMSRVSLVNFPRTLLIIPHERAM